MPKKKQGKSTTSKERPLTEFERKCVEHFNGNQAQAVVAAGSKAKNPKTIGSKVFSRPWVQAALKERDSGFFFEQGVSAAERVTLTRNDIINRLDTLSQDAESDAAKVSALRELKDIFGMSSRNSDYDPFAGWTIEELEEFHRSGRWPDRYAVPAPSHEKQPGSKS